MGIISGNEPDSSNLDNMPVGLYYYYIDKSRLSEAGYLGWVSTIESVTFNPFIEENNLSLYKANFDTDRYGTPSGTIPNCYRIVTNNVIEKVLGEIKLFPLKSEIDEFDDIRLHFYPFKYYLVTDYINSPLIVKPELVKTNSNTMIIKVLTAPLSQEGKYNIFVDNYKYDSYGNLEGIINNTPFMLPVSSSSYSQFLASSSASFHQGNINAMLENDVTLKQGLRSNDFSNISNMVNTGVGIGTSLVTGNIGGIISNAASGVTGYFENQMQRDFMKENATLKENAISSMANAKITDMLTTPKALKTCGTDTLFNLANGRFKIDVVEYGMNEQQHYRVLDYLQRYGYAQNKYMRLSLANRKYFTFIKTNICNVIGEKIPHADLEEIKTIFNSGITFWNMDNVKTIGDYQVNNEEVN